MIILNLQAKFCNYCNIILIFLFSFSNTCYSQVSGYIYYDFNSNGIQDANERGVSGILIQAFNASGIQSGSTATSGANGFYSISDAGTGLLRVEFTAFPNGVYDGKIASGSNSNIQFVTAPASNVNLGILNHFHYCQDDPKIAASFLGNGNPLAGGTAGQAQSCLTFPYSSTGINGVGGTTATIAGIQSQTGAIWGLAYQKSTNTLFAAANIRRHSGLGPLGISGIYKIQNASTSPTTSSFFSISSIGAYDFGSDPHTGLPASKTTPNNDPNAYDQVGRIGIGDMDISDDGKFLYFVNLKTKKLFAVFINNPFRVPTPLDIEEYTIPNPGCANSEFVPYGVKYYKGKLYIGVVCIAQTSRKATDLKATVYEFNHIIGSFTNIISGASFPLNYTRGNDFGSSVNWQPWTSSILIAHQPILANIEFDPATNEMFLGFMDRTALQWGFQNYGTTGSTLTNGLASGDILALCSSGTQWTIESNGTHCLNSSSGSGNGQGPSGGEYFVDYTMNIIGGHDQPIFGGLALKPGSNAVIAAAMDPLDQANSGGVLQFSTLNGLKQNPYQLYQSSDASTFGNSASLGDLECLCNPNPIELGNRVWRDTDENGRQDPGEAVIANQQVQLYNSNGVLLATTATDANGVYKFNDNNAAGQIFEGGSYEIRIPITGQLTNLISTVPNQYEDHVDSDATTSTDKTYAFIFTGLVSYSNHNLDFGFRCGTNEILPFDFEVCPGSTINLCSADLGTGATYSWNTGASTRCISVTIDNPINYSITVTASNGCTGVDGVNIGLLTGLFVYAGDDRTICQGESLTYTAQSFSGIGPFTYLWNNGLGTNPTITVTPNFTTTYVVTITDASGCTGTDDVVVNVRSRPTVNTAMDKFICIGNSTSISATGSGTTGPYTVYWSGGLGTGASKTVSPTLTTTYYSYVKDIFGCSSLLDSQTVFVDTNLPTPNIQASRNNFCKGLTTTLTATGGTTYSWSNGFTGSSQTVTVSNTTTYTVTATNSTCTATSSITINVENCGSLGDKVWQDVNGNGIQDVGENGLPGINVQLFDAAGILKQSSITNSLGIYSLDTIKYGNYYIKAIKPSDHLISPKDIGNDANDSDVNPNTGESSIFTVNSTVKNTSIDIGMFNPAVIGNYVWIDEGSGSHTFNGIQDIDEVGAQNVKIYLYNSSNLIVDSSISNAQGNFQFQVPQGSYFLKAQLPFGKVVTLPNVGADDSIDSDFDGTMGLNTTSSFVVLYNVDNNSIDLGIASESLPLELIDFSGYINGDNNHLQWITANESNIKEICLEELTEGSSKFEEITCEDSKQTKLNQTNYYKYIRPTSNSGNYLYRLKIIEQNGFIYYSKILQLEKLNQTELLDFKILPNPCKESCHIKLEGNYKGQVSIEIKDLHGKVYFYNTISSKDISDKFIDFDNYNLIPNIYIVTMKSAQKSYSKKFVKQ